MLKCTYYPGYVAKDACRKPYLSTAALTDLLGIESIELKKAACCGLVIYQGDSQLS
ncbi:MAG: hypothetical protein ACP8RL_07435 [cyanobacterium endosymbiont of Rhopalodia inflata]